MKVSTSRLRSDLAWDLARAYCPRPGEDPCTICYDDAAEQLEEAGGDPDAEAVEWLKSDLASGKVDILDIAEALSEDRHHHG